MKILVHGFFCFVLGLLFFWGGTYRYLRLTLNLPVNHHLSVLTKTCRSDFPEPTQVFH